MPPKRSLPSSDLLTAECVLPLISTHQLGHQLYHYYQTIGSTNAEARSLASSGAPHGSLVVAETQTAGRGRQDRHWISPPGVGIYITLILRPTSILPTQTPLLTLLAAVATSEAITRISPDLTPTIKWPNDILINGHKVAGILAEMVDGSETTPCILMGIGINVNTPANMLPERPLYPASSLSLESGHHIARAALLAACLEQCEYWLNRIENEGTQALLKRWSDFANINDQPVTLRQQKGTISGVIKGIDDDGALLLLTADNTLTRIFSGDLVVEI